MVICIRRNVQNRSSKPIRSTTEIGQTHCSMPVASYLSPRYNLAYSRHRTPNLMHRTERIMGVVDGPDGFPIPTIVDHPASEGEPDEGRPVILILHGFKGFATWGFFPLVAERIAAAGMTAVRMNFSHNGVEGVSDEFTRLDLFEQNTLLREVSEADFVLDRIAEGKVTGIPSDKGRKAGILGHSRGAGIGILTAARRRDVGAVVTWGGVSTFERYSRRQREQWLRDRYIEVLNSRTGQAMRLGIGLLEELENQGENLDIVAAVHKCPSPLLILHGEIDLSVTVDNAERLFAAGEPGRTWLHTIPKTGHTFGVGHPLTESTPALDEAIDRTISFYSGHLL